MPWVTHKSVRLVDAYATVPSYRSAGNDAGTIPSGSSITCIAHFFLTESNRLTPCFVICFAYYGSAWAGTIRPYLNPMGIPRLRWFPLYLCTNADSSYTVFRTENNVDDLSECSQRCHGTQVTCSRLLLQHGPLPSLLCGPGHSQRLAGMDTAQA